MMTPSHLQTARVFVQFLIRDIKVYASDFKQYLINYALAYPLIYAFAFAYIQANVFFGNKSVELGTIVFAGNIIIPIMVVTYRQAIELLFDLENDRFVNYQMSVLSPRLVILERIMFSTFFTFTMTLPFFPVAKLALGSHLDTSATSWPALFAVLLAGSFCCAGYHQLASCVLKNSSQISTLWSRINHPLLSFGGFWIPLYTLKDYSPIFAKIALFNPILYISEGIRQAMVGGPQFLSIGTCIAALCASGIIFILITWHVFKRRVDHI